MLFPEPATRRYIGCPRCGSPHAFVTLERTDTQCSFCPMCRHLWDTPSGAATVAPAAAERHS